MNYSAETTPALSSFERETFGHTSRIRKATAVFLSAFALALPTASGDDDMAPPENNWPIGMYLPPSFRLKTDAPKPDVASTNKPVPGANILAWVPPDTKRIRAVLIIVNNAQSKGFGEHPAVREIAKKYGFKRQGHAEGSVGLPRRPRGEGALPAPAQGRLSDGQAAETGQR